VQILIIHKKTSIDSKKLLQHRIPNINDTIVWWSVQFFGYMQYKACLSTDSSYVGLW